MKKIKKMFLLIMILLTPCLAVSAADEVKTAESLAEAVKVEGEYKLAADLKINQLFISAGITLDGGGHTLTSANTALDQATAAHKADGLSSTFRNITFDGANQRKTDTCLWIGRGTWTWHDVTLCNWTSSSAGNRGAITVGKSANDPGRLNLYGTVIRDNLRGLSVDHSQAIANVYGITAENNKNGDICITSGTLNFLDDESRALKSVGTLVLDGGTVNVSGNTYISQIIRNGGTLNITGDITSDGIMEVQLEQYASGTEIAVISDGVDKDKVKEHFKLPDVEGEGYILDVYEGRLVVKRADQEDPYETLRLPVEIDYSKKLGESRRIASGVLHAFDYKTPAQWLTDGIEIRAVRGQAHQREFDGNYEYLPGFLDAPTYGRLQEVNPDARLMLGLYYGFKGQKGSKWQAAALENEGQTWKNYIKTLMGEVYREDGPAKRVYSWIPWNEPDLQWGNEFAGNFRTAYRYAYEAVKEVDESALVQAPETTAYNFAALTNFLTYCKEHQCIPDVLSWHELTAERSDTEAHCRQLQEWLAANGIEPMPFAITEYQGTGYGTTEQQRYSQGNYNTGLAVAYIAGMERAEKYGLAYGLCSAWGLPGNDAKAKSCLGEMADFDNANMPTGLWYVYNAYRDMTGSKIEARHDGSKIEVFASADGSQDKKRSTVLLGNWDSKEDRHIVLTLDKIPDYLNVSGNVHVRAESLNETLAVPCYGTQALFDEDFEIVDGKVTLKLTVKKRSAVKLILSPPVGEPEFIAAHQLQVKSSAEITADGLVCLENGRPSSYIDNTQGTKTYKDTCDSITFSYRVPADGIYNIYVKHGTGGSYGFTQMYVDDVSTGTPTDLYSPRQGSKTVNYGNVYLKAGTHELRFIIAGAGKNTASTGYTLAFESLAVAPAGITVEEELVIKAKADQKAANAVIKKIRAIGKVTNKKKNVIAAARAAYRALTPEQKKLVANYNVLAAAEKTYRRITAVPKKGDKFTVGDFQYEVTKSTAKKKTAALVKLKNKKRTSLAIPKSIKINSYTYKVTAVGGGAFRSNTKIKSVTIGDNVASIGKQAFLGCRKLAKVTIKTKALKKVGKDAFKGIRKNAVLKVPKSKKAAYRRIFQKQGFKSKSIKT